MKILAWFRKWFAWPVHPVVVIVQNKGETMAQVKVLTYLASAVLGDGAVKGTIAVEGGVSVQDGNVVRSPRQSFDVDSDGSQFEFSGIEGESVTLIGNSEDDRGNQQAEPTTVVIEIVDTIPPNALMVETKATGESMAELADGTEDTTVAE